MTNAVSSEPEPRLRKYPRTPHLEGSRPQPGDEDLDAIPWSELAGRHVVIEEKVDGANAAISFALTGAIMLQSRGHFLTGGPREVHFALFKRWANAHAPRLRAALGSRYILYGEWLYAKHTMFYDRLPNYFLAFDVLDTRSGDFLDTPRRGELLHGLPIAPAPVLFSGQAVSGSEIRACLGRSSFVSGDHLGRLRDVCARRGLEPERILRETDPEPTMEGLYIKVEEDGVVRARCKYVRPSFLRVVREAGDRWLERPIVPNQLRSGVDIFVGEPILP